MILPVPALHHIAHQCPILDFSTVLISYFTVINIIVSLYLYLKLYQKGWENTFNLHLSNLHNGLLWSIMPKLFVD